MRFKADTIDEAIAHTAVLTNRIGWLAPERLDVQRTVWLALVERYAQPGVLTLEDFTAALTELLEEMEPRLLLPHAIVQRACNLALYRHEAARHIIDAFDANRDMVMYEAITRYWQRVDDDPSAADKWLCATVESMVRVLATADFPDEVTLPVMAHIHAVAADNLAKPKRPVPELPTQSEAQAILDTMKQ